MDVLMKFINFICVVVGIFAVIYLVIAFAFLVCSLYQSAKEGREVICWLMSTPGDRLDSYPVYFDSVGDVAKLILKIDGVATAIASIIVAVTIAFI